jgi:hypothetical protein
MLGAPVLGARPAETRRVTREPGASMLPVRERMRTFSPGRRKALESTGFEVGTIDRFSGGRHLAAIAEELTHGHCAW